MLRKFYRFIDDKIRNTILFVVIAFMISFVPSLVYLISNDVLDTKPATAKDYNELIIQCEKLKTNFNSIYSYDNYTIVPKDNTIVVTLTNKECELLCTFDKNLKYLNYKSRDLCCSKVYAIFIYILTSFMFGVFCAWIFAIIVPFCISYFLKGLEKICYFLTSGKW